MEEAEDDDSFRTGKLLGGTAPASSSGPPRSVTMTAGMFVPMAVHWSPSPAGATTTSLRCGAGPDSSRGLLPSASPTAGTTSPTGLPEGSAVLGETSVPPAVGASFSSRASGWDKVPSPTTGAVGLAGWGRGEDGRGDNGRGEDDCGEDGRGEDGRGEDGRGLRGGWAAEL